MTSDEHMADDENPWVGLGEDVENEQETEGPKEVHEGELPLNVYGVGDHRYTIPSEPPKTDRQRRSWWSEVLKEAREHPDEWRLVVSAYSKSTACQLASDIRNAHRRAPEKVRIRGLVANERWDARYAPAPDLFDPEAADEKRPYLVWLVYLGSAAA